MEVKTDARRCVHQIPMRSGRYLAQLVLPADLTKSEADRLCQMLRSMVMPPVARKGDE